MPRDVPESPIEGLPFPPMEATLVRSLPEGPEWRFEPKWDGFRGVLENLEGELHLWSRNARPLLRYFPELAGLGDLLPPRSALDGEIVIVRDGVLDFDSMQTRLHPAESRIRRLSAEIPALFIAFDVLVWKGEPQIARTALRAPGSPRGRGARLHALADNCRPSGRPSAGSTPSRRSDSTA